MAIDLKTISTLRNAGIEFVTNVRVPGGSKTIAVDDCDLEAFLNDPSQYAAGMFGVSKDDYLGWVATDGTPRCGAKTTKGTRCRNFVSGGIQRSIDDWMRLDGGYCAVHGGESSEEASKH